MIVKLRWFNWAILVLLAGFGYLFVLVWRESITLAPDVTVDLKELIKLSVVAAVSAGQVARSWHFRRGRPLSSISSVVRSVIVSTIKRYPAIHIVRHQVSNDNDDDDYFENSAYEGVAKPNYFQILMNNGLSLEQLPSTRVAVKDASVWISSLDSATWHSEDIIHHSIMVCIAVSERAVFGLINRPFENELVWGLVGHACHPNCTVNAKGSNSANVNSELEQFYKNGTAVVDGRGSAMSIVHSAFGAQWSAQSEGDIGYHAIRVLNGSAQFLLHTGVVEKRHVCAVDAIYQSAGAKLTSLTGAQISYASRGNLRESGGLLASLYHHYYYMAKILPILNAAGS